MKKKLALGLAALLFLGATIVPDSYDKLFCRMNGTGTSFVDDSTANTKTLTANGNATQISIPESWAGNRTAMFFDGTSYVSVAASSDFGFGTGDFKITTDVIFTTAGGTLWDVGNGVGGTGLTLGLWSGTLYLYANTGQIYANSWSPSVNTKYKVTCQRVGTTVSVLIDDAQLGSTATSSANLGASNAFDIGRRLADTTNRFAGWMKNLTITKAGVTVLDMRGNTSANMPLGPAIAFDGTGDYLEVANSNDYKVGTGDYTLEGFFNTASTTGQPTFISMGAYSNGVVLSLASGSLYGYEANVARTFTWTPTLNKWHHIRLVRVSGTLRAFIDGKQIGSDIASTTDIQTTDVFRVGLDSGSSFTPLTGYAREVRFSNVARDSGTAFTPSQTGFVVDANTKLYVKGNENNGATTFVDSETTPKTITTAGDTKIKYTEDYRSCIFKDETGKFPYPVGSAKVDFFAIGAGAGYFDGTGDYLSVPDSADWNLATDSFTLEFYLRPKIAFTYHRFLGQYADASNLWKFGYDNDYGMFNFSTDGGGGNTFGWVSDGWAFTTEPVNGWMHVSLVRDGTSFTVYVNGTSLGTKTGQSGSIGNMAGQLEIGRVASLEVNGLLDNVRISKGVARYTATFNPPEDFPKTGSSGRRKSNWFFFF